MSMVFDLTDKVAIVIGGNGGISYGMARGLAEASANIVVAARQPAKTAQRLLHSKHLAPKRWVSPQMCKFGVGVAVACAGDSSALVKEQRA